jgi:hypothetical protein
VTVFDIAQIRPWAFGISNEQSGVVDDVWTAYLLFYRRSDLAVPEMAVPDEMQARLNRETQVAWPAFVFYSQPFLKLTRNIIEAAGAGARILFEFLLIVFFRIVVPCTVAPPALGSLIVERFSRTEYAEFLFDFVDKHLGQDLGTIAAISEVGATAVFRVLAHYASQIPNSARPGIVILRCADYVGHRRLYWQILPIIATLLNGRAINWSSETPFLKQLIEYMVFDVPKEGAVAGSSPMMTDVFNRLITILIHHNATDLFLSVLDAETVERLSHLMTASQPFQELIRSNPVALPLGRCPRRFRQFMASLLAAPAVAEVPPPSNLEILWENVQKGLFSEVDSVRRQWAAVVQKLVGSPSKPVIDFLSFRSTETPFFPSESASGLFFVGLLPDFCRELEAAENDEIIVVMCHLCFVLPRACLLYRKVILKTFVVSRNPKLLVVLQRLFAFDNGFFLELENDEKQAILDTDFVAPEAVALVRLFRMEAENSVLSGAALTFCFRNRPSGLDLEFLALIRDGLVPRPIALPQTGSCLAHLAFANELWELWPENQDELRAFMAGTLSCIGDLALFAPNAVIARAREILG